MRCTTSSTESLRPQFVVLLDQSLLNDPELDVEFIEVLGEEIALQFMLDNPSHEAVRRTTPTNPTNYLNDIDVDRIVVLYEEFRTNEHARSRPR